MKFILNQTKVNASSGFWTHDVLSEADYESAAFDHSATDANIIVLLLNFNNILIIFIFKIFKLILYVKFN